MTKPRKNPNPGKWQWRKKIVIGLPSAYLCAIVMQLFFHILLLNMMSRSLSAGLEALVDPGHYDWYCGMRYFTFMPLTAERLIGFFLPIALFTVLPNLFTWLLLTICLSFAFLVAFLFPALMGI